MSEFVAVKLSTIGADLFSTSGTLSLFTYSSAVFSVSAMSVMSFFSE